jgi:hypothetical protein
MTTPVVQCCSSRHETSTHVHERGVGVLNATVVDILLDLAALRKVLKVDCSTGCAWDYIHSVLVLAAGRHLECCWVEGRRGIYVSDLRLEVGTQEVVDSEAASGGSSRASVHKALKHRP